MRPVAALAISIIGVACGGPAPSSAVPTPPPSSTPAVTVAPASSPSAAGVAVDPALLDALPAEVGGLRIEHSAEGSDAAAADPGIANAAEAVAYGVAGDRTSGDLLVVAVTRLRPGIFNDAFFRGWRDSYDREVCASGGGVIGNAEAQLGGRTVYIGSCGTGRTYHAWLEDRRVVVSAYSVGKLRLGEKLMVEVGE